MPKLFLGVLAVAWIVVLVPPVLRARHDSRSRDDSIGDFQNRLGVLGHTHFSRHSRRATRGVQGRAPQGRPVQAPRGEFGPMPGVASALGARSAAGRRPNGLMPRSAAPRPLTGPVEPIRTRAAERAAQRRREVVTVLFTLTMLSAAVASAIGGRTLWGVQILADVLLLIYVAGMAWFRSNSAERMRTVHYLPQVRPRPVPAYALRRTASN